METVSEWRLVIMGWFIMSVGRFPHMSDIYVTYRFEDILIRRITHCAEFPRYPLHDPAVRMSKAV